MSTTPTEVRMDQGGKVAIEPKKRNQFNQSVSLTNSCCCSGEYQVKFALQAVIIWCVLCLPGNLVTFLFLALSKNANHVNDESPSTNKVSHASSDIINVTSTLQPNSSSEETCEDCHVAPDNLECHELESEYDAFLAQTKFWLDGIGLVIVGVFGLVANALNIIVIGKTKSNRSFNKLLVALAIVDSLLIISEMGETAILGIFLGHKPTWYKFSYPYFIHPVKGMIQTATIFMIVAISAERYKAICYPLSYRQKPLQFILLVVFISVGIETPRFFHFHLIENGTEFTTTPLLEDPVYIQFSSYWDEMLVTGLFPLLALAFFNLKMVFKIRSSGKFNNRFVGQSHQNSVKDDSDVIELKRVTNGASRKMKQRPAFGRHDKGIDVDKEKQEDQERRHLEDVNSICLAAKQPPSSSSELTTIHSPRLPSSRMRKHQPAQQNSKQNHLQKRREKSTIILVLIVLIFIACHSYRLSLRVYEFANPSSNTFEHFTRCSKQGRYHVPVVFFVLVDIHHLFLVVNSSINFLIYCSVGKDFRQKVVKLFSCF